MNTLRFTVPSVFLAAAIASACGGSDKARKVDALDAGPDGASSSTGGRGAGGANPDTDAGAGGAKPGTGGASAGGANGADASLDGGVPDATVDGSSPPVDTDSGAPTLGVYCDFPDSNTEGMIRSILGNEITDGGLPSSGPIPTAVASSVKYLELFTDSSTVFDLTGIGCLRGLESVLLGDSYSNLDQLRFLPNLRTVAVEYHSKLPEGLELVKQIRVLDLSSGGMSDLSGVENLTALEELNLANASVLDLTPIAGLTNLRKLDLQNDLYLTDLTPIAGLTKLVDLSFGNASVSDLSPLANLKALVTLNAQQNKFTSVAALQGLTNLNTVYITSLANVTDFAPLVNNAGIGAGDTVSLSFPQSACATVKPQLATLTGRGATLSGFNPCP